MEETADVRLLIQRAYHCRDSGHASTPPNSGETVAWVFGGRRRPSAQVSGVEDDAAGVLAKGGFGALNVENERSHMRSKLQCSQLGNML